jgi:hypothetical protein
MINPSNALRYETILYIFNISNINQAVLKINHRGIYYAFNTHTYFKSNVGCYSRKVKGS